MGTKTLLRELMFKRSDQLDEASATGCLIFTGYFKGNEKVAIKSEQKWNSQVEVDFLVIKTCYGDLHPNIIRYFSMEQTTDFWFVATETWNYNLETYIDKTRKLLRTQNILEERLSLAQQMASSLAFVHQKGWVHTNINLRAFVIKEIHPATRGCNSFPSNRKLRIKLTDLGFTRRATNINSSMSSNLGKMALEWNPPDLYNSLRDTKLRNKIDVWALGCVIFCLFCQKKHPFQNITTAQKRYLFDVVINISEGRFDLSPLNEIKEEKSIKAIKLKDLLASMIDKDPQKRPTMKQVAERLLVKTGFDDEQQHTYSTPVSRLSRSLKEFIEGIFKIASFDWIRRIPQKFRNFRRDVGKSQNHQKKKPIHKKKNLRNRKFWTSSRHKLSTHNV